ncbi:glycerol-3-phosphate dehydrogenase C-terminal domain-containing protein [Actinokineospora sp.]|uniref:glycerol-3-phosphate dehydrogenase C-terminal domain-containing protein n=1 Tax=Actinokineospora sp. TaxID=1872133 RepID=UPI003D69FE3F
MWEGRAGIARRTGLAVSTVEHLLGRYGSAIDDLIELIGRDPGLAEPIHGAEDYLRAEAVCAVTHEGALRGAPGCDAGGIATTGESMPHTRAHRRP